MEDRKVPVPDLAAFRIDFPRWLRMLTGRDRKIVYALTSGERTSAVAERFGLSEGRVSQLRRKFEQLWRTF
ncbi:MAG: helix-turn-helix domain-containing protein [Tepidisphaeraceae bacterium]